MRSPIGWFGGKGNMRGRILPTFPPHKRYVEPFGGGASLLLAKEPVELEVYNDLDHALYEFFTTLADPGEFERFYRRVALLPYSRELYNECQQ
jgi:DNA adenine methylase